MVHAKAGPPRPPERDRTDETAIEPCRSSPLVYLPYDLEGLRILLPHLRAPVPREVAVCIDLPVLEETGFEIRFEGLHLLLERSGGDRDVELCPKRQDVSVGIDRGLPEP